MNWWGRLLRRGQMEEQLEKELRFHLEQHKADLMARGQDAAEAFRNARLALGGPEQVKEGCRDARGTRWLEDLAQDFRYAVRTLRQKPGFTSVALATLGLGIGAATVMFTVINGVLLKPLPYRDPGRLVELRERTDWSTHWGSLWAFSYPNFLDCQREARSLEMAAWRYGGGTVSRPGDAEYVEGREISSGLFAVLGVSPALGRSFLPGEDQAGAVPVAVISYALWQRRFAGRARALGTALVFEGKPYTIVGVAPAGFQLVGDAVDLFTPLGQDTAPAMGNRDVHPGIRVVARLRPGATLTQARHEVGLIGRRLTEQFPQSNRGRTFVADPLGPPVEDVRGTLWLLLGAVSVVLLIGCVNIASLLLARAVSREREMAMRAALGASRGRLARQCLTESGVLGLAGGALGILAGGAGLRPFLNWWPGSLPRAEEVRLDWHVLLFAAGVSIVSGLLFGLSPALRVPVRGLEQALRAGARSVAGGARRLHSGFVATEIALAVVLLIVAGMLGRTMLHLTSLDPGLDIRNVLTARMALSAGTLADPGRTRAAWRDVLERAARVPGIRAVALVDTVPLREGNNQIGYRTSAAALPPNQEPLALATSVTPGYLNVMGIPLRRGRFFEDQDRMGSEPVAVVDEVLAREAFGGTDPLGRHLWIGLGSDPVRIVGVVGHVRYWGPAADDRSSVRAQIYYPFAQVPDPLVRRWSELMSIAVRTEADPSGVVEALRREVRGAGGDQVVYEVRTMAQLASAAVARQRFLLLLFGVFAGLALVLACTGIYGVLAYLTSRRVAEFGLRIALGASTREVLRLVLAESLRMIAAGAAVGIAGALAVGRLLQSLVEGMEPPGAATFLTMTALLGAAALAASFLPARRASRVDPMQALRQD